MRSAAFIAIGLGFILMGAGLFALTLPKTKENPHPTKAQLREQASLAEETKKLRVAAGIIAGVGVVLCVVFLF